MRFSDLDGLRVGVWGLGAETRSFASHLSTRLPAARIDVVVLDAPGEVDDPIEGSRVVTAAEAVDALSPCDALVRSPGVSIHRPELRELARRGMPVSTPTGLWMHERGGRNVLGITGTKGKSTTATLTAHLARAAGAEIELAGNIGRPALDLLDVATDVLAIVELSSYQIADLPVGPEIAMALNVYPEHLDWHLSFEAYEKEKLRLLSLPEVQTCILNAADERVASAPTAPGARVIRFGDAGGWHTADGGIWLGGEQALPAGEIPTALPGPHNALNLCAALTALDAVGIATPALPEALQRFTALPHRLEPVPRSGDADVLWVDDSISTTPESAIAAIQSFPDREVVLIGGGFDRGQDYTELGQLIGRRKAVVIGLPTTGERLVGSARAAGVPQDRAFTVEDLPAAVIAARELAEPGGAVLLSPAAPSYNTYTSHIERGKHFKQLVREHPPDQS